jgi:3-oxoadipate enol-lactonase
MSGNYQSDGARLAYVDAGEGLPVLFLHPTPLDREYWFPLKHQLAGIRAVIPDLRGHGVSELGTTLPVGGFVRVPDAPALTMELLASDMIALLDHLQLDSAVFAGCSIGGYVMLELWRIAPKRMRGLAFICSKPQPDAEANLAKRAENIARAGQEGVGALFDGMSQNLVAAGTRREDPEIVAQLRSRMTLTRDAFVAVQAGLAIRPDSAPTVATINAPLLAVAGSEDTAVSPSEMEAFRGAPGGCEYHVLDGAGHFSAYEQPQKMAGLVAPWLRRFSN